MTETHYYIKQQVDRWLTQVVLGLQLCPFAAKPVIEERVKIVVSPARSEHEVLEDLHKELELIDQCNSEQIETTLLVVPGVFQEFDDYNQFLNLVDALLEQQAWSGEYQIASFHPAYQFANTNKDDVGNLTNRSPYPILQILREASVEQQLADFSDPGLIPEKNIRKMNTLTEQQKQQYFPYLFL